MMNDLYKALVRMLGLHDLMAKAINNGAPHYDANTIREMNEAPIQAQQSISKYIDWESTTMTCPNCKSICKCSILAKCDKCDRVFDIK